MNPVNIALGIVAIAFAIAFVERLREVRIPMHRSDDNDEFYRANERRE